MAEYGVFEKVPETATLHQERNGVKWYIDGDANHHDTNHYMEFNGRIISAAWVLPKAIFFALVAMTPEERTSPPDFDSLEGAINRQIHINQAKLTSIRTDIRNKYKN